MTLNSLISHHLCSAVCTHTLLLEQPVVSARLGRRNRYALAALIAAILLWFELPDLEDSHYARAGIPITLSHYEIVSRHMRVKSTLESGKTEGILHIKRAFEVLLNEERRKVYDRFGDLEPDLIGNANLPFAATALAFAYHILSCIICAVMFQNGAMAITRYGIFLYSGIAFALEIESRFIGGSNLFKNVFYFDRMLPFQRALFLRGVSPALGLLLNVFCVNCFVDTDGLSMQLWKSVVTTNRVIMERMSDVVNATAYLKSVATSSSASLKAASQKDGQKPVERAMEEDKDLSDCNDVWESLDDNEKRKVLALMKSVVQQADEKKKSEGYLQALKAPAMYLLAFLVVKYFSS
ncbi:hypothetical protein BgAZ_201170 [Babesia gibsoni]|uniref:Uncharacterized protein n=1 Tax=Babesia gibsoni TaxID=33632 RepID=A0AAD8LQ63_BABGI|nr:hypothetical protein BgAZ_201170 [Babesia gibsoni]